MSDRLRYDILWSGRSNCGNLVSLWQVVTTALADLNCAQGEVVDCSQRMPDSLVLEQKLWS